ncbi:MAG: glycosyltransferase family 4 protein [Spirosomataceae bacterium]
MRVVQTFTVPMSLCFLEGQTQFWKQNGYELHILSSSKNSIETKQLNAFGLRNELITNAIPFRRKISPLKDLQSLYRLKLYFQSKKPQIVHGNTPKAAFLSMLAAWYSGVPIRIYEMHGLPLETATFGHKILYKLAEKWACHCATHVIAVSHSLRQTAIDNKLVSPPKISVMHNGSCNGVDAAHTFNPENITEHRLEQLRRKYQLTKNQPIVGFVGRLVADKGIDELYKAWQSVKHSHLNAKLLLIGGDEEEKLPEPFKQKLQSDSDICWTGEVSEIAPYYALMDFLVLPSHREGFGNVVLEAAAMGKPTIGFHVTGLKDAIVENETGIFCRNRTYEELAEKILFYLQNPETAQRHGKAARQRALADFKPLDIWLAKGMLYRRLLAAVESVPLPHVSPLLQATD